MFNNHNKVGQIVITHSCVKGVPMMVFDTNITSKPAPYQRLDMSHLGSHTRSPDYSHFVSKNQSKNNEKELQNEENKELIRQVMIDN